MKQFKLFTILALSFMLFSCGGNAQSEQKTINTSINRIEVIGFHSTHRCMTCNAIEANTKYTLSTYFADELKSGKITSNYINVDKEENLVIAEKYEASGTSLFLNVVVNGVETTINLTEFAFSKGRKKEEFARGLKYKIEKQLEKI